MKNLPIFTTENGAASLILREIPYREVAYIRIHSSERPRELARECAAFCRACGAEQVYATGHPALEIFPLYTRILRMSRSLRGLPKGNGSLWPVLPENLEQWREIYNRRMAQVPNSAYMTRSDGEKLLAQGDGYFVHRDGALLGIGRARGDTLLAAASVERGGGRDTVLALCGVLSEDRVVLEAADTNTRAMRLYSSLGFLPAAELSRWYSVE